MRGSRIAWLLAGVILGILACVGVMLVLRGAPAREVRQADGTMIRLEKISFGKREPFTPGSTLQRLKQALAEHLPKKWAGRFANASTNKTAWYSNFYPAHTNEPALQVWISRIDPVNGSYQNVDVRFAEIEDEDGCIFGATIGGGEDSGLLAPLPVTTTGLGRRGGGAYSGPGQPLVLAPGASGSFGSSAPPGSPGSNLPPGAPRLTPGPGVPVGATLSGLTGTGPRSSVTWFTFEVFPRRDKQFKIRFMDSRRQPLAEFTVDNPTPTPPPVNWQVQNLPATITNGDVLYLLKDVTVRTNTGRTLQAASLPLQAGDRMRDLLYVFDALENGTNTKDWDPVSLELWDSSGNHAVKSGAYPYPLCPRDPAWKMEVKFIGRNGSAAASNATWTISDLEVPSRGRSLSINSNIILGGVVIKVIGLGGAGKFIYSNGELTAAALDDGPNHSTSMSSSTRGGIGTYTFTGMAPHLALALGQLSDDQRLSVHVTDNSGKEIYAREFPNSSGGPLPLRGSGRGRGTGEISYIGPSLRNSLRGNAVAQRSPVTILLLDGLTDRPWYSGPINITISLHNTHTVDFFFKPPGSTGK